MKCPRCQQDNPPQAKFCLECGAPLGGAVATDRSYAELQAENEGLRRSLGEASEQQTATAEILRVISNSPTDLQPVLGAMAERAARLCAAYDAIILRLDGEVLRRVAHHGPIAPHSPAPVFPATRDTVGGRTVLDRRPIHVADLQAETKEFPVGSAAARQLGSRTVLGIPLLREGAAIGVIYIRRTEVQPFTEAQIALLQTFADQAVIAIENVRLFNETKEALEQQTATAEILRAISASPTDVQPVLDAVAESAARICGAQDAMILRVEGESLRRVAHFGAVPLILPAVRPLTRESMAGRAALEGRAIQVPDMLEAAEEYPESAPQYRGAGLRTGVAVPLLHEGAAIGVIGIRRTEVRPFTDKQIALLQTFADQAVIAIENVRLFTELQKKNRALSEAHAQVSGALARETATSDILRVIGSSPTDAQPVFETIARSGLSVCAALGCVVFVVDGAMLRVAATEGVRPERLERFSRDYPIPLSAEIDTAQTVRDRRIVHLADIAHNPNATASDVEYARLAGYRTRLMVPMVRGDRALGLIAVTREDPTPFPDELVGLLRTFADQAVIAIENVRLFRELEARNRELTTALDTQTATSDILRVISHSQTDVQPVFDAIVNSAVRLLRARSGTLSRVIGDQIELAAHTSTDDAGDAATRAAFPQPFSFGGVHAQTIRNRAPLNIADAQTDPRLPEATHTYAQVRGYRSQGAVPMLRHDEAVGAIAVTRREPGGFTDDEIGLLQTFADQAVIAIENVRLFKELEDRNRDLTATSEILQVISRSPTDVQPVLDAIARRAVDLCRAYFANIFLVEAGLVHWRAGYNVPPEGAASMQSTYPLAASADEIIPAILRERQTRALEDAQKVHGAERPDSPRIQRSRAVGLRSWVGVPLLRDGNAVGALAVARQEVKPFSDKQIALLETFADQAVIAIENVRLFTELQEKNRALTQAHAEVTEALAQQTATSEILRVISGVHTDTQPVFETIVQSAVQLCKAATAAVFLSDGRLLYEPANYGSSPELLAASRARYPRPLDMNTTGGIAVLTRSVVHVPDIEDPLAIEWIRQSGRLVGFRSVVTVPMLREGDAVGAILVTRRQPGRFSDTEVKLLKTFADQAVIAVENVRLFKELEARTAALSRSVEQLTALGEVGRAVSSTLDLETVLTTIVSRAVQLSGLDGGVVFEYDEVAEEFVQRAQTETGGALAEARRTNRIRKGEGVLGQTAITLESVQVSDITVPGAYAGRLRENLIESGVRAILAVPMVYEGRLIGCLGVTRNQPGDFPGDTIELLRTFATQSALAIQHARLFREIEIKSRELEAASRHKSEFLANMSHELRTPLNAIIGFSEVLGERMFGELNEKQDEYLKDIHASGQHLLSLINDILDLSKIEAGRMDLELTDFNLPATLDNALTLVRERAGRHGVALHVTTDERVGQARADERKIRQVILNLLSNAIKFTPDGGRIDVRAAPGHGGVEVSVSDTGVGIAPEDQEAIFEEFRQVGTAAKKVEGTGLGLALSRKFIELHGGRIWVQSQVGVGSTFTFTIPVLGAEKGMGELR